MDRPSIKARGGVSRLSTTWTVCSLVLAALATGREAAAQCNYEVTAIIQAPECPIIGPPPTIATGISELGHVVGYYQQCGDPTTNEAFLWTPDSGLMTLERPPGYESARANDINDAGRIVGLLEINNLFHAALWQGGMPIDLGTMPAGNSSLASAINEQAEIAGWWGNSATGDPALASFVWRSGEMVSLDLPLGPNSVAADINELGQIVGWMGSSSVANSQAFLWEGGIVTNLGAIPGGLTSNALAVNNTTVVVGVGQMPAEGYPFGLARAFLWQDGAMVDLGAPTGYLRSAALDLDAAGSIIGRAWGGAPDIGLIWADGVMHDLNDLIPPGSGVAVHIAHAINARGQIACQGQDNNGNVVGLLLTPLAVSPADVNADGTVNVLDLIDLLLCFGQPAIPGCESEDVNGDGAVNVLDLIDLLLDFGVICREQ